MKAEVVTFFLRATASAGVIYLLLMTTFHSARMQAVLQVVIGMIIIAAIWMD
jgi:hypothetical protein